LTSRNVSEHQLQSKLDLPRRAGFTSWEARGGDPAECRRADDVARLPEVRMVEKVEELGAELRARGLADLRILDDRKINVVEARPDDHVASQTAEARDSHKDGGIEPTVYVADDVNRTRNIGPERAGHTVDHAVGGNDVDRVAALRLDYRSELPALDVPVAFDRQFINRAQDETVARVEVRQSAVTTQVVAVLHDHSLRAERIVVERLRERIGCVELQASRKALIRCQPHRVVTRGARALDLCDGAELRARQD